MRGIAIGAAAVAALVTATAAWAQGPAERKEGRGERAAPQQGAAPERMQRSPGQMREQSPRADMREQRGPRSEGMTRREPGAAQLERREDRRAGRTMEREPSIQRQRERSDQIERRAEQPERAERRRERTQAERLERGERRAYRPDERIEQRTLQERERVDRREGRTERGDAQLRSRGDVRAARTRLTPEQQARLRTSFDRSPGRVTNVRFTARIGTRIPRRARLHAIPAAVLAIVPAYRDYRYVYYEDSISIVDPVTYEIVDVIDYREGPGAPQVAELELSAAERAIILDSIGPDFPSASASMRLALGAEIPGRVELHPFPDIVLDRVPKLRNYRFVVADDDVVIVDPRQREIALILRR
jgi:hypothetical protein